MRRPLLALIFAGCGPGETSLPCVEWAWIETTFTQSPNADWGGSGYPDQSPHFLPGADGRIRSWDWEGDGALVEYDTLGRPLASVELESIAGRILGTPPLRFAADGSTWGTQLEPLGDGHYSEFAQRWAADGAALTSVDLERSLQGSGSWPPKASVGWALADGSLLRDWRSEETNPGLYDGQGHLERYSPDGELQWRVRLDDVVPPTQVGLRADSLWLLAETPEHAWVDLRLWGIDSTVHRLASMDLEHGSVRWAADETWDGFFGFDAKFEAARNGDLLVAHARRWTDASQEELVHDELNVRWYTRLLLRRVDPDGAIHWEWDERVPATELFGLTQLADGRVMVVLHGGDHLGGGPDVDVRTMMFDAATGEPECEHPLGVARDFLSKDRWTRSAGLSAARTEYGMLVIGVTRSATREEVLRWQGWVQPRRSRGE